MRINRLPVTTTFIKVNKWHFVLIYLLIPFPSILLSFITNDTPKEKGVTNLTLALVTHILFVFYWFIVNKMEIHLYQDGLLYRNAFTTKEICWKDITESKISSEVSMHGRHSQWFFISPEKRIVIDNYYFSKKDKRLLAEALIANCSKARISTNIIVMANGKAGL